MSKPAAPAPAKTARKLPPAAEKAKAMAARLKPPTMADPIVAGNAIFAGISIVMVLGLLIFVGSTERRDRLYAYNSSTAPEQLQYSDNPNISSEALINWCKMVVGELFTYNFNDVYQRMDAAYGYFTKRGWDSFAAAFMASDVFNRTQAQRIFVSTLPSGVASVISEGDVNGRYTWTVQIAAVTRIYSGTSQLENNTITMTVEKIPTNNSLTGYPFGIVKITR